MRYTILEQPDGKKFVWDSHTEQMWQLEDDVVSKVSGDLIAYSKFRPYSKATETNKRPEEPNAFRDRFKRYDDAMARKQQTILICR